MKTKNLYLKTILTTIIAMFAYAAVTYVLRQSFEWASTLMFAVIFGVVFFFTQRRFKKRAGKRK